MITKEKSLLFSFGKEALTKLLNSTAYGGIVTIQYGVAVYLVRYETQDRGKTVEATMAMAFPDVPAGQQLDAPYVLWLHGTSGFMDACAPTANVADAAVPVALMASQGYIGVAPDYLGMAGFGPKSMMPHPYLGGEPTALASLDALRAAAKVVAAETTAVVPNDKLVVWGGSQGGDATLFALLHAPYYAPQYELVAGLALVPAVDLVDLAQLALAAFQKGTVSVAAAAVALSRWYGHDNELRDVLTDAEPNHVATLIPQLMDTTCDADFDKYNVSAVSDLYTAPFVDAVAVTKTWTGFETWRCLFAENSLPVSSVKPVSHPPIFFQVSENDEIIAPASQRRSFDALCQAGYQLEYLECAGARHTKGAQWSLSEQFAWLGDRMAGKPLARPCQRSAARCCSGSPDGACPLP